MTEPDAIHSCPVCYGPAAPSDARRRGYATGGCRECRVPAPETAAGETLHCARSGRELTDQDFRTGRAIRLYSACLSIEAIREKRRRERETGEFHCDACNARLTALDLLSREAIVVDKVVLCPSCRRKRPDPAGNGRKRERRNGGSNGNGHGGDPFNRRRAVPVADLSAPAEETTSAKMPAVKPRVAHEAAAAAASGRKPAPAVADEPAGAPEPVLETPDEVITRNTLPVASALKPRRSSRRQAIPPLIDADTDVPDGEPLTVPDDIDLESDDEASVDFEPPAPSRLSARARLARNRGGRAVVAPDAHAWGTDQPITVATSGDLRWATGAMVLMVFVLCGLVIAIFLMSRATDPNTGLIVRLKSLDERIDRLNRQLAVMELKQEGYERQLREGPQPPVPGPSQPAGPSQPTRPDTSRDPQDTGPLIPSNPLEPDDTEPQVNPPDPTPQSDDPVLQALASESAGDRLDAVLDVNRQYHRRAIPALLQMVRDDPDDYVRAFAIRTLAAFGVTDARDALTEVIATARVDSIVAEAARDALAEIDG